MADSEENVGTLMELTSLNFDEARDLLVSKGSLQAAIDSFFNEGASGSADAVQPVVDELDPSHPDYIRPPIAPKRDILVLPEDDNFRGRPTRRNTRQTLCPMRNFAREAELQEQMLYGEGSSRPKRSRLEDVFRPPTDIIFSGTFQMTKEFAKNEDSWLLVNLQDNTEFACQILNRDVWSNQHLKSTIKKTFIFYQTSIDCIEGNKIKSFYNVTQFPYVAILDPRTGEEKISYRGEFKFSADQFAKELHKFLHNNFTPDYVDSGKPPKKFIESPATTSTASTEEVPENSNIFSLTEEEQLEIAIKKSMEEAAASASQNTPDSSEEDFDDTVSDGGETSSSQTKGNAPKDDEVAANDDKQGPPTKLMLRLPNGKNEIVQRNSLSSIGSFIKYLLSNYKDLLGTGTCRVNCPAIRKDLCDLDKSLTLVDAKLHPSAVLHISTED